VNRLLPTSSVAGAICLALLVSPALVRAEDDDLLEGLGEDEAAKPPSDASTPVEDAPLPGGAAKTKPTEPTEEEPAEPATPGAAPAASDIPADLKGIVGEEAAPAEAEAPAPETVDAGTAARLDRVKAVQRKPVIKALRAELTPIFAVSLNDSYFTHLIVGAGAAFYLHDSFGIGLRGAYFLAHPRSNKQRVIRIGQTAVPATFDLPTALGSFELHWVPIYGKIALINSLIVPFDLFLTSGVGFVTTDTNVRPSFSAGVGQRFMVNDWMAIRIEVNDTVFNDTQTVNGQPRSDLQNYVMFNAGFSFFIPPTFDYTTL